MGTSFFQCCFWYLFQFHSEPKREWKLINVDMFNCYALVEKPELK